MHLAQALRIGRRALTCFVRVAHVEGGDVDVLAADHAAQPSGADQLAERRQHPRGLALLSPAEEPHRLGEQPIAGEDRDVLAEFDVRGRHPPPQLVVVHRRQIVVNQGVGVDQLDRRRRRQHVLRVEADRAGGGQRQDRPDPLATSEQ